jgi:hypothetical protein
LSEKDIYKELLIDKTKKVESVVRKAKDLLGIDKDSGDTLILISRAKLTDREIIGLHLIGKFFASELGLASTPSATAEELSRKTGIDEKVVSARLHDLKLEGYVRSPKRGEHEIIFPRIDEFLDFVRQRAGIL